MWSRSVSQFIVQMQLASVLLDCEWKTEVGNEIILGNLEAWPSFAVALVKLCGTFVRSIALHLQSWEFVRELRDGFLKWNWSVECMVRHRAFISESKSVGHTLLPQLDEVKTVITFASLSNHFSLNIQIPRVANPRSDITITPFEYSQCAEQYIFLINGFYIFVLSKNLCADSFWVGQKL